MSDAANETVDAVVFTDDQGELYAVPVDLLDQLRVPEEHHEAVRKELEEAAGDEVSGFALNAPGTGMRIVLKSYVWPPLPSQGGLPSFRAGGMGLIGDHGTGFRS
jgi:hypothetical protein